MTASAFPLPASFDISSFGVSGVSLSPDEIETELHLLGLLRANGLTLSAERRLAVLVARAPHSEVVEAARTTANQRLEIDAWLAERHGSASRTLIPSATLNTYSTPRFVIAMPRDAGDGIVDAISRELAGKGADAELRNFLDESLTEDMAFVDFDPGVGFAVFSAATAPTPPVAAYAVTLRASDMLALDVGVQSSALTEIVQVVRNVAGAVTIDSLAGGDLNDVREFIVHAGVPAAIPAVIRGALSAIRDGRVAAVTWRCAMGPGDAVANDVDFAHDIDNAGTVLAVLGFEHFALAQVDDDVELVPLSTVSGNTLIISLSREYMSRTGAA